MTQYEKRPIEKRTACERWLYGWFWHPTSHSLQNTKLPRRNSRRRRGGLMPRPDARSAAMDSSNQYRRLRARPGLPGAPNLPEATSPEHRRCARCTPPQTLNPSKTCERASWHWRFVRRARLTKGNMTARKKYSICIRNYNRCVRTRNYRRALYWSNEADRQADRVAKRVQFYINQAFA